MVRVSEKWGSSALGGRGVYRGLTQPDGAWARLSGRAAGFLSTELYRDSARDDRYLTIDRWREEAGLAVVPQRGSAYDSLDAQFAGLALQNDRCSRDPPSPARHRRRALERRAPLAPAPADLQAGQCRFCRTEGPAADGRQ